MIAVQFIFSQANYDDEFHELDNSIADFARNLPGHVGVEKWLSEDGKSQNSIYYFTDRDALAQLAGFSNHLTAKSKVDKWYSSYQVVVTEVLASYGSHGSTHLSAG
jgi:antibiotic biosynthesis monooxygenase (ABM) superfamily enzyme